MAKIGSLELRATNIGQSSGILLLNSSSPWASDINDLQALYESPHTAAVTTRTAVLTANDIHNISASAKDAFVVPFQSTYAEDTRVHSHCFLKDPLKTIEGGRLTVARGSLNSYGYSPFPLSSYLTWIATLFQSDNNDRKKPVILSITGPPDVIEPTLVYLRRWIAKDVEEHTGFSPILGVEINLSCPNIKGNDAPSGYDTSSIAQFIVAADRGNHAEEGGPTKLSIGLKLPPYIHQAQFKSLIDALSNASTSTSHPIAFLTSTNTLGSSLWFNEGENGEMVRALPWSATSRDGDYDGTGGLAGESLHPVSLGNVFKITSMLNTSSDARLHHISVIGVGGVISGRSAQRMRAAGADAVGMATALGREGIDVFERISNEISDEVVE